MDVITLLPPGGSGRKVNPSDSNNSIKHSTASLAEDSDEIEGTREVSATSIFKKEEMRCGEMWIIDNSKQSQSRTNSNRRKQRNIK